MPTPTILVPGIKGTTLVNTNTLDFDTIWSGVQSKFESVYDLALKPDTRFEAAPRAIIERSDVEDLAYREAVLIIAHKTGSPVYIFGYDWRKSCAENGERLKAYVDLLKEKLQADRFNFVTHSMGGMVFSCFLKQLAGDYDLVEHAVLTVCPFNGSIYALVALIVGEGGINFPLLNSNDEFRKIARSFPSVYELLPVYPGAITRKDGKPFDLYNPAHWQSNLAEEEMFRERLAHLKAFRVTRPAMQDLKELPVEVRKRFVIVVAEGEMTKQKVVVKPQDAAGRVTNFFDLDLPGTKHGDGTVPSISSTLYKREILTIGVQSKWYDRATHAFILNDGRVQNIINRFLKDDTEHPDWWSSIGDSVRKL
ncbi:MAG: alpha/beta hydrolase [Planctomycetes bacterium]|nr:alpha/beta hydrolase [Planctomycetota bacterium]